MAFKRGAKGRKCSPFLVSAPEEGDESSVVVPFPGVDLEAATAPRPETVLLNTVWQTVYRNTKRVTWLKVAVIIAWLVPSPTSMFDRTFATLVGTAEAAIVSVFVADYVASEKTTVDNPKRI